MRRRNAQSRKNSRQPVVYRTDLINGAMGAQRLTNELLARKSTIGVATVSAIRNGDPKVGLSTLKAVLDALGLTLREVFEPQSEAERSPISE